MTNPSFSSILPAYLPEGMRVGIGCAWLGRDGLHSRSFATDAAALEAAYGLGFRYFDTSAAYGQSEFVVGEFAASVPRESIFLATKARLPDLAGLARQAGSAQARDHFRRSFEESLRRLKTGYIDLFQVHDVESLDLVMGGDGVLEDLMAYKAQGLVRYAGLATRSHSLLEMAARSGQFDTILTYADYNLLRRSAGPLVELAHGLGVGVINASPLFGLSPSYGPPAPAGYDLNDIDVLAAALQFPLRSPHIDITLTGPASTEEVRSSWRALHHPVNWARWDLAKD